MTPLVYHPAGKNEEKENKPSQCMTKGAAAAESPWTSLATGPVECLSALRAQSLPRSVQEGIPENAGARVIASRLRCPNLKIAIAAISNRTKIARFEIAEHSAKSQPNCLRIC